MCNGNDRVIIITTSPNKFADFEHVKKGDLFYASVSKSMSEAKALDLHLAMINAGNTVKSVSTISDLAMPINSEGFNLTIDTLLRVRT